MLAEVARLPGLSTYSVLLAGALAIGYAIAKGVAAFDSGILLHLIQRSFSGGHTFLTRLGFHTLLAFLCLLLFLKECCSYLLRSLSHILLSLQALECILLASGDVEENPGPTNLTGMFLMVLKFISHKYY